MKCYVLGLLLTVLGTSLAASDPLMVGGSYSTTDNIKRIFKDRDGNFDKIRHPTTGAKARADMLTFIQNKVEMLQLLAKQKGFHAANYTQQFTTDIQVSYDHKTVNGTNVILVLHGTANNTEDEPVMLLANYDTARNTNAVNEGSGVVALLTLFESLVQDLPAKNFELKSSVIFAFTDVAHKKYDEETGTPRGETGAHKLGSEWLRIFMSDRKHFRGAVVLDNLLNYNSTGRSQLVQDTGIDKSFSTSYTKLAENAFSGDFVALVHRNDDMDNPLANAIEEAWNRSSHHHKDKTGGQQDSNSTQLDAKLLRFTFNKNMFVSPSVNHFLNSEQSALWNEHASIGQTQYPAITLTDTRNLRAGCRQMCNVSAMLTDENLQFMARTVKTLKHFIIQNQTDSGAFSSLQSSVIFLVGSAIFAIYNGRY
ncbi:unnamed protein product [Allacma fusca]|uniref:Peptidase M28 domain-containing protein n=1 Tax=Allacma fusca TaxID=39272 RepID=A0A8J2PAJ9_9HEXA|nr:unnamed protein product [Allacma fusca]